MHSSRKNSKTPKASNKTDKEQLEAEVNILPKATRRRKSKAKSVNSSDKSEKSQPTITKAFNMTKEIKKKQVTKPTSQIAASEETNDDIKLILKNLNEMQHDNQKTNLKLDDITDDNNTFKKALDEIKNVVKGMSEKVNQ